MSGLSLCDIYSLHFMVDSLVRLRNLSRVSENRVIELKLELRFYLVPKSIFLSLNCDMKLFFFFYDSKTRKENVWFLGLILNVLKNVI